MIQDIFGSLWVLGCYGDLDLYQKHPSIHDLGMELAPRLGLADVDKYPYTSP